MSYPEENVEQPVDVKTGSTGKRNKLGAERSFRDDAYLVILRSALSTCPWRTPESFRTAASEAWDRACVVADIRKKALAAEMADKKNKKPQAS